MWRADDGDDEPQELAPGGVQVAGDSPLPDLLLSLITDSTRLAVLLGEATEEEWRAARGRLAAFLGVVDALPRHPPKRRRLGFEAPPVATTAARKRRNGRSTCQ